MSLVVSGSNGVTEPGIITIGTSSGLWLSLWANLDTLASGDDTAVEIYDPTGPRGLIVGIQDDFSGVPGTFMFRVVGETSGTSGFFNVGFNIASDPTSGWHHAFLFIPFGASTPQTNMRMWWDGTEATVTDYSGGGTYTGGISSATLNIGYGLDPTTGVDGNLAEVGIWSSAVAPSTSEISDLSDSTGATRPGDLTTSATLLAYAPLETGYALDTPTGTLTDIGTGATSIASGTHPTMAAAGGATITITGTGAEATLLASDLQRAVQVDSTGAEATLLASDLRRSVYIADSVGAPPTVSTMRHYAYGLSLWCYDPSGTNQADVGNVMDQVASAGSGLTYGGAGDFSSSFTPSNLDSGDYPAAASLIDNMPLGTSHWTGTGIAGTGTTHAVLMENNINYPGSLSANINWGNAVDAASRIASVLTAEPGCNTWFLLAGEADMAGATEFGGGGTPYTSATWLSTYQPAYNSANEALQDSIQAELDAASTSVTLQLIPVGHILVDMLNTGGVLDDFTVSDLFVDDAPHRNQTWNLIAGAICFCAMFQQRVPTAFNPSTYTPPGAGTVDARVITRWTTITNDIWSGLLLRSERVFGQAYSGEGELTSMVASIGRAVQASATGAEATELTASIRQARIFAAIGAEATELSSDVSRAVVAEAIGAEATLLTSDLRRAVQAAATGAEATELAADVARAVVAEATGAETTTLSSDIRRAIQAVATGAEATELVADLRRAVLAEATGVEATQLVADLGRAVQANATGAEATELDADLARAVQVNTTGAESTELASSIRRAVVIQATGAEATLLVADIEVQTASVLINGVGVESTELSADLRKAIQVDTTGAEATELSANLQRAVIFDGSGVESTEFVANIRRAVSVVGTGIEATVLDADLRRAILISEAGEESTELTADIARAVLIEGAGAEATELAADISVAVAGILINGIGAEATQLSSSIRKAVVVESTGAEATDLRAFLRQVSPTTTPLIIRPRSGSAVSRLLIQPKGN